MKPWIIVLAILLFSFTATADVKIFKLWAKIDGYIGIDGDIDGIKNPTLNVKKGDEVTIEVINGDYMAHNIVLRGHEVQSILLRAKNQKTTVTFTAINSEEYYCSLGGHRRSGMVGLLEVSEVSSDNPREDDPMDEISRLGSDLPPPLDTNTSSTREFSISTKEVTTKLDDGTTFEYWTFNDRVPGPFLRVREGDNVVINVQNDPKSKMVHSIDFHAVTGPGGGATLLQVPPGEKKSIKFKALKAGIYVYHCATPHVATHLAHGMYGLILVEPKEGLPKVDREFYVMQGEYYTKKQKGFKGLQTHDDEKLFNESPTYIILNGRVGGVTESRSLKANVGEVVRIYFGVGGPNKISSFHIIGEIFDRVYSQGSLVSPPLINVQTTLVPPGGAVMVEFELDVPGKYLLVDHALSRLDKGALGILEVSGKDRPDIINKN